MSIKKIRAKSPNRKLSIPSGNATFARLADVNELVDQINNNTPTSAYKVYTALLTQSGDFTVAPTITVLENTIDPAGITITGTNGQYTILSSGNGFGSNNTCFISLGSNRAAANTGGTAGKIITKYNSSNSISIWSMNDALASYVTGYGLFNFLSIEIRVYN